MNGQRRKLFNSVKNIALTKYKFVTNHLKQNNKKQGFTLLEVIMVISIITILCCLALPSYLIVLNKAQIVKDISNARVIYEMVAFEVLNENVVNDLTTLTPIDEIQLRDHREFIELVQPKPTVQTYPHYEFAVQLTSTGDLEIHVISMKSSDHLLTYEVFPNGTGRYELNTSNVD